MLGQFGFYLVGCRAFISRQTPKRAKDRNRRHTAYQTQTVANGERACVEAAYQRLGEPVEAFEYPIAFLRFCRTKQHSV